MNPNTTILLWGPLIVVLAIDFVFLKFRYRKPAAIERIVRLRNGTRLDLVLWLVFYFVVPAFNAVLMWTTVPGIVLIGLVYLAGAFDFDGLLSGTLPTSGVLAVMLWLCLQDFCRYASHFLLHKVPALWNFHKVHHAAEDFNIITGNRLSLAENFFHSIIEFALLGFIIGIPAPHVVLAVLFIRNTLNLLEHSDLPWDYGVLGYVIVSPRFHRMHHSSHVVDADTNFGAIFSFWDYLFGTVSPRYRSDSATADVCEIGLTDKAETRTINDGWLVSAWNGTPVDYLLKIHSSRRQARAFDKAVGPDESRAGERFALGEEVHPGVGGA
jgi:sterol desaturase/sphingolipid hydroxylase (fatty acid hydroxylase superfamily)